MPEATPLDVEQILKYFRDLVGAQAQEIAVLRATIESISNNSQNTPSE
jgi:hypothetical protein